MKRSFCRRVGGCHLLLSALLTPTRYLLAPALNRSHHSPKKGLYGDSETVR